jgi:CHAT domain-containing protein
LAVLSACETGIGKEFHGEGVFSVARGFAYAGCPSIVMSLWRVDDIHSAKIMETFYRELMKGNKTAQALRVSKIKFLKSAVGLQGQPANWAAFVMLGINKDYGRNAISFPILIITFSMILFFILIAFRRKFMELIGR